jgi:hypothetical protein
MSPTSLAVDGLVISLYAMAISSSVRLGVLESSELMVILPVASSFG